VKKFNPKARHRARRMAVQALYQWQLVGHDIADIEAQFLQANDVEDIDVPYFTEALHYIPSHIDTLDGHMTPYLDRAVNELSPVELAVLRLGVYELSQRIDTPYKVVLNEAVELAKVFGAAEGHRYINGVLDKVAGDLRKVEKKGA